MTAFLFELLHFYLKQLVRKPVCMNAEYFVQQNSKPNKVAEEIHVRSS